MITVNMSAKYKEVMTQVGAVRKALRCSVSEVRVLFWFGFEKKLGIRFGMSLGWFGLKNNAVWFGYYSYLLLM